MKPIRFAGFPKEGLEFLRSLKRNNKREWFHQNKNVYETLLKEPMFNLIHALSVEFDRFAPDMVATPKASAYRIHRDTRFSKDKSPYKTHIAAVFPQRELDKHGGAGFYIHIDSTEVFVGGGLYMPMPEDLSAVRWHIARNYLAFKKIVEGRTFRRLFGELTGEQLTRVPRGFPPDHPAERYLKYKQFLAVRRFKAMVATTPSFFKLVVETLEGMTPVTRFLNEPILKLRRTRARQEAMLNVDD